MDVITVVEDQGRGDRCQQGSRDRRAYAKEGNQKKMGCHEQHSERGGNQSQRDLVDIDVAGNGLQTGRQQRILGNQERHCAISPAVVKIVFVKFVAKKKQPRISWINTN